MRFSGRHSFLSAETGAVTAITSFAATPEERRRALSKREGQRILRSLGFEAATGDRHQLVALLGILGDASLDRLLAGSAAVLLDRLSTAIEAGRLIFVAGWGWPVQEPEPDRPERTPAERVVRTVMAGRPVLAFEGRSYRLVESRRWRDSSARDHHQVVPAEEASLVLSRLATTASGAARRGFEQAVALLSAGSRPGEEGLLLLRRASVVAAPAAPLEPALTPSALRAARKVPFSLVVVDAGRGQPLPLVTLDLRSSDGVSRRLQTDAKGSVSIPDLDPGTCEVTSVVTGGRVADSYGLAAAPVEPREAREGKRSPACDAHIVDVARHRIRSGQTPTSIAAEWGVPWNDIALFNWGTVAPDELEGFYRQTLGCARKAPDGQRYLFDDQDEPGIILIPRPWKATLANGAVHQIHVASLRTIFVSLENDAGLAIPAATYEAHFVDGTERRGTLGRRGIARLEGVPEGPFTVAYPDDADLLAKSLAVSVRHAFDEQATAPLFNLLMQDQEIVDRAMAAYDRHLNDLTGRGLIADIDQVVTDPEARGPLLALCALAGLPVEGVASVDLGSTGAPL